MYLITAIFIFYGYHHHASVNDDIMSISTTYIIDVVAGQFQIKVTRKKGNLLITNFFIPLRNVLH
jgi:hypothetical protein